MLDYSKFFVDPRPGTRDAMEGLARAGYRRKQIELEKQNLLQRSRAQNDINRYRLSDLGLRRDQFTHTKEKDAAASERADRQLTLQEQRDKADQKYKQGIADREDKRLSMSREKAERELTRQQFGFIAEAMEGVNDQESYDDYKDSLRILAEKKMIPEAYLSQTFDEYREKRFQKNHNLVKWIAGMGDKHPSESDKLQREKFETEQREKNINEYADGFLKEIIPGVQTDDNGNYGKVMTDATGEQVLQPLTPDEHKQLKYAKDRGSVIADMATDKGISFQAAALEYEMLMAQREAEKQTKKELKNRAAAHTPQHHDQAEPVIKSSDEAANKPFRERFSEEDLTNPVGRYVVKDMGKSWTFGKSAKEIAKERGY